MADAKRSRSVAEKLAATLLLIKRGDGTPLVPEEARNKSAKEIIGSVRWDHFVPLGLFGTDEPQNKQPLTVEEHGVKTKRDVKNIARSNRLTKEQEDFRRAMLAKSGDTRERDENDRKEEEKRRILGTRAPRPKRKIKSQGFRGWRTFGGEVRWKKDRSK